MEHVVHVVERRGVVLGTFGRTRTQGILGKDGMIILKLNVNKEEEDWVELMWHRIETNRELL